MPGYCTVLVVPELNLYTLFGREYNLATVLTVSQCFQSRKKGKIKNSNILKNKSLLLDLDRCRWADLHYRVFFLCRTSGVLPLRKCTDSFQMLVRLPKNCGNNCVRSLHSLWP